MRYKPEDVVNGLRNCSKKCCYDCAFKGEIACRLIMMTAAADEITKLMIERTKVYEDIEERIQDMAQHEERMLKAGDILEEISGMRRKAEGKADD